MRLIDADALRAEFTEPNDWSDPSQALVHITGIWAYIDNAPTVDAVEVVRCRDCKHYRSVAWHIDGYCHMAEWYKRYQYPDDFCSRGERRGNVEKP